MRTKDMRTKDLDCACGPLDQINYESGAWFARAGLPIQLHGLTRRKNREPDGHSLIIRKIQQTALVNRTNLCKSSNHRLPEPICQTARSGFGGPPKRAEILARCVCRPLPRTSRNLVEGEL